MKWYWLLLIIIGALVIGFGFSFAFTEKGAEITAGVGGLGGEARVGKVTV